jgi:hypothetical protein
MYRIYGIDGFPNPCQDFITLELAISYGMITYDLFSIKNLITGNIEWSNFLIF